MNTINLLAKYFTPYITITGLDGNKTYPYEKRFPNERFPIVTHDMHREKCRAGSWLYIAVDDNADLSTLNDEQKLYVGSQTKKDRMFRGDFLKGDALKGKNFHHNEMRKGNDERNLISYLQSGKKIKIYVITGIKLTSLVAEFDSFKKFLPFINYPSGRLRYSFEEHPGYYFEQIILRESHNQWAWNTRGVDDKARKIMDELSI